MTWYRATRHTFANRWVMGGGSVERLKEMTGHSTVPITERYAHLKTDLFGARDLGTIALDLRPGSPEPGTIGHAAVTASASAEKRIAQAVENRTRGDGGTGRRARLRIWFRKKWGFESPSPHSNQFGRLGLPRRGLVTRTLGR
jgi:hypothetical protein